MHAKFNFCTTFHCIVINNITLHSTVGKKRVYAPEAHKIVEMDRKRCANDILRSRVRKHRVIPKFKENSIQNYSDWSDGGKVNKFLLYLLQNIIFRNKSRTCDLTPLDYFLWGVVKDKCYANHLEKIEALKHEIEVAIHGI